MTTPRNGLQRFAASANFTRPANTTAYGVGDLVANHVTAGSVVPMSFALVLPPGVVYIRRATLKKSTNTTTDAAFRLHLYLASPTPSNGDNGAWLTTHATYLGAIDITVDKVFSDSSSQGEGVPNVGSEIIVPVAGGGAIYGLLEARAAYAPGNAEVFTLGVEGMPA
jgi:hypothetical protein